MTAILFTVANFANAILDLPFASTANDAQRTFVANTEKILPGAPWSPCSSAPALPPPARVQCPEALITRSEREASALSCSSHCIRRQRRRAANLHSPTLSRI